MSSFAAVRPPVAVYREEQYFSVWIYLVLGLMICLSYLIWSGRLPQQMLPRDAGRGTSIGVAFGIGFPVIMIVGVLKMTTEVYPTEVRVTFGWLPSYRKRIDTAAVLRVESVTYRPMTDCGGWGVRSGRDGEKVLNARGNRGVRIHFRDGSKLLIGSQRPDALARAVDEAAHPSA